MYLQKIQAYKNTTESELEKWLCTQILESNQDPQVILSELISYGGKTGAIGKLIYYKDIYPFFEAHYEEFQHHVKNFLKNGGVLLPSCDLKSEFTWIAAQAAAKKIADSIRF